MLPDDWIQRSGRSTSADEGGCPIAADPEPPAAACFVDDVGFGLLPLSRMTVW